MSTTTNNAASATIRIIRFGDGRLNTLGATTRQFIHDLLETAMKDSTISSIVLMGKGSNFSAGADLTEFSHTATSSTTPSLLDLVQEIESSPKLVVAAISGVCLGGALELAMACHGRICTAAAKMGLPEVSVGVIPGAGGTQRLPRCIGIERAIQVIVFGKQLTGAQALEWKLVDAVMEQEQILEYCTSTSTTSSTIQIPFLRLMDRPMDPQQVRLACLAVRQQLPKLGSQGMHAALDALDACARPDGQEIESHLFYQTLLSSQGKAKRHAFFAVRAAQKSSLLPTTASTTSPLLQRPCSVGVIGAGLMGSGIAMVLLQAGYSVILCDVYEAALNKGIQFMEQQIQRNVDKKMWTPTQAATFRTKLTKTTTLQDLSQVHLVVEAVVENLTVKKQLFAQLNDITLPTCLLLSNTSTLSIDEVASALHPSRRGYCAGWHFFSPAHIMKLVEIVVAKDTLVETTSILEKISKTIGKISVTVGNCDGFVGNRMLNPYTSEAVLLLAEGVATIESIDTAICEFGIALGPFQMSDLAGNDIGYFIRKERGWTCENNVVGPNRPGRYTELGDDMVTKLGRIGQKVGKGWYDYDPKVGRKGMLSEEMTAFVQKYVPVHKNTPPFSSQEIIEQILFPLVNEGFKILEEGIAEKPSDIDVVYLYGYGWPSWRGGPMYWADEEVGLAYLLTKLQEWHLLFPGSVYFQPSKLLVTCVTLGVTVQEYYEKGMQKQAGTSKL